ncbi:hypothetical protein C8Q76DRAFT_790440 [Earliella scabrosa]|nr:hypothetical protein C8Q76DRAFT_790440 [Earliella scabrosa]
MSRQLPRNIPTPEDIQRACDLSSQLYHAWTERPPTTSPARRSWDGLFTKTCKNLIKVIGDAHFTTLPAFVIGCIWEFNNHCRSKTEIVDAEAIRLASTDNHPAFDRSSPRSLCYTPSEEGPVVLQEKNKLSEVWWEVTRETATQPSEQPSHSPLSPMDGSASGNPPGRKRAASSSLPDDAEEERADPGGIAVVGEEELCEEEVPETIAFNAGSGCDSCCKVDAVCEVDTFAGTVCKHCKHIKTKCSFMQINPKTRRCFLVWRLWKLTANGADSPSLIPLQYLSEAVEPPAWWQALLLAKRGRARKRLRTSEAPVDVRRSRSASQTRSIPPVEGPSANITLEATSASVQTRAKSKNRALGVPEGLQSSTATASAARSHNVSGLDGPAADVPTAPKPPVTRRTRASVLSTAPELLSSGACESATKPGAPAARKGASYLLPPPLSGSWRDLPTIERRQPPPQALTSNTLHEHHNASRACDSARDSLGPFHEELLAIAGNQKLILERVNQVSGEASSAVQALLADGHQQLLHDLRDPLTLLALSLASAEMTPDVREALLYLSTHPLRAQHAPLLSERNGPRDDPDVVSHTSRPTCLSAAISQLRDRLIRVEGSDAMDGDVAAMDGDVAMNGDVAAGAPDANVEQLQSVVRGLEARIEKLETA